MLTAQFPHVVVCSYNLLFLHSTLFHCVNIPPIFNRYLCLVTIDEEFLIVQLLSVWGYYKHSCYYHSCAYFSEALYHFSWV